MRRLPLALAGLVMLAALGLSIPFALARGEATAKLTVNASDYKFKPNRPAVAGGTLVITLVNKGKVSHDLRVAGKKTRLVAPGGKATLRVKLKAGRYKFICTVPGHAALGMRGVLTVKQTETTEG